MCAVQLWCVMDKQVPPDLSQDVLELWQELHTSFSALPNLMTSSAHDASALSHTKHMQQALMHALLGEEQPTDMSTGMPCLLCTCGFVPV